jgi:hypothetical protein
MCFSQFSLLHTTGDKYWAGSGSTENSREVLGFFSSPSARIELSTLFIPQLSYTLREYL